MRLYLVQHGISLSENISPHRHLSEEGRRETERIASFLKQKGIVPEIIWHSGKLRAKQTAEIFADILGVSEVIEKEGLKPNDSVELLRDEIEMVERDLMIVGHLPFLAKLCFLLITGDEERYIVEFRYSGVLCLDSKEKWEIYWYLTSELI